MWSEHAPRLLALLDGTAMNLFVRDMPRLSVDLDPVFPDHTLSRDKALARIQASLRQDAARLKKRGFQRHAPTAGAGETKLLVRRGRIEIKVEVNFVMRGTVRPVRRASLPLTRERYFHKAAARSDSIFHFAAADTEPDGWGCRVIARDHAKRRKIGNVAEALH
jgi:nucleotidyltransferase AbiEii toxin of type IV toxin-antitoxin system